MQGSRIKSPRSLLSLQFSSKLGLRWPTHPLQACLLSFNGNKGDRPFCLHPVLPLSPALSLYRSLVWLGKRTVPSLSLTANYFWPTYPDRKVGMVFSLQFLCCCFFFFLILHAALLGLVFVSQKRLIGRRERKAAPNKCRYCWQHVTSKSLCMDLNMCERGYSVLHSNMKC